MAIKYQILSAASAVLFFLFYVRFWVSIKKIILPSYDKFKELFFYYRFREYTIGDRRTQLLLFAEYVKSDALNLKDFLVTKLSKEKTYVPSNFNAYDLLRFWKTKINKATIFKLKTLEREGIQKPNFNLGKTYNHFYVFGIKKFQDLYYLVDTVISCCLSSNEPLWNSLTESFDVDVLKKARLSIEKSSLSRKKLFFLLSPFILKYKKTKKQKDLKKVVDKFISLTSTTNLKEVKLLLSGLQHFAHNELIYDSIKFKLQNGELRDIFDNETTGCCSLAPTGPYWDQYYSAMDYLTNKSVALLHIKPHKNDIEFFLLGVVFLGLCKTQKNERVLLIDSLEAAQWFPYNKFVNLNAIHHCCLNSIKQIATEMNVKHLFFCSKVVNFTAKEFIKFIKKTYKLNNNPDKLYLELLDCKNPIYLDAFYDGCNPIRIPKGIATGYSVYIS
jgi:hypothetical protein